MEHLHCPHCGSRRLRRSRTLGFKESLMKKLGWRAYRCRAENCQWRGLLRKESLGEILAEKIKGKEHVVAGLVISAIILATVLFFLQRILS